MIVHALDIPEDADALPAWLEEQLVGLNLASLVAELAAVHADGSARRQSLDECLGNELPAVLSHGLAAVPRELLRQLLAQPWLLLDLQEQLLVEGGPYWDQRQQDMSDLAGVEERGWQQIRGMIASETPQPQQPPKSVSRERRPGVLGRTILVALCTAALVLVAVFVQDQFRPVDRKQPTGWGWNRTGALAAQLSGREYLEQLASLADEWFAIRPATPDSLARRIAEFRQGCSTLILAEHEPLAAEDRQWLVERCRAWAGKLDRHLADVEAGRDVDAVKSDADETVRALIQALRTRAAEAA